MLASQHGVVNSVFESFLERLRDGQILDEPAQEALRSALLEQRTYSAEALRRAMYPTQQPR